MIDDITARAALSSLRHSNDAAEDYIDAQAELKAAHALVASLRADLASAHEHVGALLSPEGRTAATKQAAMAWLRRGAK